MRKRSMKTAAWLVLALALFLGCWSILGVTDRMARESIGPECLVTDYEDSGAFESIAATVLLELDAWLENPSQTPDFGPLEETDLSYYAASGNRVLTNAPELADSERGDYRYQYWRVDPSGSGGIDFHSYFETLPMTSEIDGTVLTFYIHETYVEKMQNLWEEQRVNLTQELLILAGSFLAALGAMFVLCWGAGRTSASEDLTLITVDHWMTEFFVAGTLGAGLGAAAILRMFVGWQFDWRNPVMTTGGHFLMALVPAALSLFAVIISIPLVRKTKARTLVSGSLTGKLFALMGRALRRTFRGVRGFFDSRVFRDAPAPRRIFRSQVTYICVSAGLLFVCGFLAMVSYSFFFVLVFVVLELLVTAWHVFGTRHALEEIRAGLDSSRQAQVKSENIKTALITNVSHDLKTPLTSIISYVDLLSREEGLSDAARDYVNVLAGKADRLNHMVSDLFDLSKSISGNIPLEMDVLDLRTLLEQTLADMKDKIEASGLTVKANLGDRPVPVFSDGKKLYRVFQNLIDNGLKYGLAGSRLFIDLAAGDRMAEVAIKNTAAYEMDFTPEEILQRFTRGDKARSGEGSGLGLSIAESFTQSCGGRFAVEIDGDQFKAAITLPIHDEGGR